jgi:hypothetical protein
VAAPHRCARLLLLTNLSEQEVAIEGTCEVEGTHAAALSGDLSGTLALQDGRFALTLPPLSVVAARLDA